MRPLKGLVVGVLTVGIALWTVSAAFAERVPTTRADTTRANGTRPDITVPYLNNGSNFNGYSVAPLIYATPQVNDPTNPGVRPTYNLPVPGLVMGFGNGNNGGVPRSTEPKTSRASR